MNDKKALIYLGVIVLVIIAFVAYKKQVKQNSVPANQDSSSQTAPAETKPTAGTSKLPYGQAILKYVNRFQFVSCHGNPGIISVKKGTPVMLDNRDAVSHTIKANGQTFRIAGYNYAVLYPAIVTIGDVTTASSNVTCDGGGAATLNVEK